ncbi:hypothetical protein BDP27DRAFT_1439867 [Rhodocollybia butyracea]|uniref:Uncharacterized protein n=1 Tax=Rhodocollybia butyracea TaxID=206335 RepID=A0A9P5TUX2_9AGAR|nr:hypothetical protein BDP27DRAFT_1439867 [Rhodocollybia butyracea]
MKKFARTSKQETKPYNGTNSRPTVAKGSTQSSSFRRLCDAHDCMPKSTSSSELGDGDATEAEASRSTSLLKRPWDASFTDEASLPKKFVKKDSANLPASNSSRSTKFTPTREAAWPDISNVDDFLVNAEGRSWTYRDLQRCNRPLSSLSGTHPPCFTCIANGSASSCIPNPKKANVVCPDAFVSGVDALNAQYKALQSLSVGMQRSRERIKASLSDPALVLEHLFTSDKILQPSKEVLRELADILDWDSSYNSRFYNAKA